MLTLQPLLDAFLCRHRDQNLDWQTAAIRQAVMRGHGVWMQPKPRGRQRHPDTHQHEVTLFGISAAGNSIEQVTQSWFKVACWAATNKAKAS